ncbi:MAG: BatA domain-containing protein [Candidatus Auribacterota bacterium]|jgi:hypothetical protein|nr:BatA domain-containing protein [Candidatus Auribacterota bacterium]
MFFANLWYLWFIPIIAAPILLNIWKKQRIKEIDFPYFSLIQASDVTNLTALHIMNLLLLLLRMLLIVGLILFMARPIFSGFNATPVVTEHIPVVFIYDNSVSMTYTHNGTTLAKKARIQIASAVKALPADIPAGLIFMNEQGNMELVASRSNPERLLYALDNISVQYYRFDLKQALYTADSFFRSLSLPLKARKNILIFTDNQQYNASLGDSVDLLTSVHVTVVYPQKMNVGGAGWFGYKFSDRLVKRGEKYTLSADVRNFAKHSGSEPVVRLFENDVLIEESFITLDREETVTKQFYFQPEDDISLKKIRCALLLPDFDIDNTMYLVAPVYDTPRIIIIGALQESVFIRAAAMTYFSDISQDNLLTVTSLDKVPDLNAGDIVICCVDRSPEMDKWIKNALSNGIGVIAFVPPQNIMEGTLTSIENANLRHPIFAPYGLAGERAFESIHVFNYERDTFLPEVQNRLVLLKTAQGVPFMEQVSLRDGIMFVFYDSAGERLSNFVRTELYVPLMHRALDHILASRIGLPSYFNRTVGDRFVITADIPSSVTWITPDGTRFERDSLFIDGKYEISGLPVALPGYYTLMRDGHKPVSIAYNIPQGEGDMTPLDPAVLKRLIPDTPTAYVDMFAGESEGGLVRRRDIGIQILIACLVVCFLELAVANRFS